MKIGKYEVVQRVGKGTFGIVYKVKSPLNDKIYAVKEIQNISNSSIQELKILKLSDHLHIVKYIDSFLRNHILYIVMEFAEQGTLSNNIIYASACEKSTWSFLAQMVSALKYVHSKGIIHRDLKPDNILCKFVSTNAKISYQIADFGIAKWVKEDAKNYHYANKHYGTYYYMAPEILKRQPYTENADIWSLGAITSFVCNNGVHFFKNKDIKTWTGGKSALPEHCSVELKEKVAEFLHPSFSMRPSAEHTLNFILDNNLQL